MHIDSIVNGIVIDHIQAGKAMEIYKILKLGKLDCTVAILKNVPSRRMGRKDIIKVDAELPVDLNLLACISPDITVDIIRSGSVAEKKTLELPETITGIIECKNPRCITTTEQEIVHIFKLMDREERTYRCAYCDTMITIGNKY